MQTDATHSPNPSQLISDKIASLGDWRGQTLARLRRLIHEADPDIVEEWKWGTAVWTHDGLVCSAGAFKDHVKLNFFKGASRRIHGVSSTLVLMPRRREPSILRRPAWSTSPP